MCHKGVEAFLARALNAAGKEHKHPKEVTSPEEAKTWLPLVHIMTGNLKKCINGTFHGVSSRSLQEYLDGVCCRLKRRFWQAELPLRLPNACLNHGRLKIAEFH